MYIQITDHCNMACAHCGYSCGPRKKSFMSLSLFEAALEMLDTDSLSIGGGEPTLHPQFWAMIGIGLGTCDNVWLATNGSQTKTALRLAHMARNGVLGCDLSQDYYHAAIDPQVVKAFNVGAYRGHDNDLRAVRNVNHKIVRAGRAIRTRTWQKEGCICEDIMVDPDGNIWSCGCKKLLLGHVLRGWNAAGKRFNSYMDHEEWEELYTDSCLFHPHWKENRYRAFAKWLKEG